MKIERRFRIKYLPDISSAKATGIEQLYLAYSPEKILHTIDGVRFFVTEKSGGPDSEKIKEYNVTEDEAKEMVSNCRRLLSVIKTRYSFNADGLDANLDIYDGVLYGIEVCVFEFENEETANSAVFPEWVGDELTSDRRYETANLSIKINGDDIMQKV